MKKPTGKNFGGRQYCLYFYSADILNFMIDIPKPIYINTFLLLGTCFSLIVFILQRNNIISKESRKRIKTWAIMSNLHRIPPLFRSVYREAV